MSLPPSWHLIPITGTYTNLDGTPTCGDIYFMSKQVVVFTDPDTGKDKIIPVSQRVTLVNGKIPEGFTLAATNDPDLNLTGWAYTVSEAIPNGSPPYAIFVPYTATSIDMADVSPVVPPPELISAIGLEAVQLAEGFASDAQASAVQAQTSATSAQTSVSDAAAQANLAESYAAEADATVVSRMSSALGNNGLGFQSDAPNTQLRTFNKKSNEIKSLLDFAGDGVINDWSSVLRSADEWLQTRTGGKVLIPPGDYPFYSDVRLVAVNAPVWEGHGAMSRLMGMNNSRIIVGDAQPIDQGVGVRPLKGGTKTIQTTFLNFSIKPADNHGTECLLLDYCDNFYGFRLDLGPYGNDGSAPSTGVRCNWTQYTEFYQCSINVNGICVHVQLPYAEPENEDHYTLRNCWLYTGKVIGSYRPGIVTVEHMTGRSAGIYHFNIDTCHLGKFVEEQSKQLPSDGIVTVNNEPSDTYLRVFHSLLVSSCLFEGVDFPINLETRCSAPDTSLITLTANSFLVFDIALYGKDLSKTNANLRGNYFQQGTTIADGIRCAWEGFNRQLQVTTPFAQGLSAHRWTDKSGLNLTGGPSTQLMAQGEVVLTVGALTVAIPHALADIPKDVSISLGWNTTWWVAATTSSFVTLSFGTAAPEGAYLRYTLECYDN